MKKLRIVELYAGTARSVEPFRQWARAELALLVDSNPHARDTYLYNFPNAPYSCANIEGLPSNLLADLAGGRVDILLGCPPCQGFSDSGARNKDDPRNKHVREFARFAAELRPIVIAMENVPALGASPEFQELTTTLNEAGYRWTATIANAAQYGSCQSRQRLLLVALRSDLKIDPVFPAPTHGGERRLYSYSTLSYRKLSDDPTEMLGIAPSSQRVSRMMPVSHLEEMGTQPARVVADVLQELPPVGSVKAVNIQHEHWPHSRKILRRMERVPEGGKWRGNKGHYAHTYGRLHRRGFSRTITTYFPYAGGGRFWHPTENRSLSLREAARIQGFPDDFRFLESSKKSAVLVGNALDNSLASLCYTVIREALD
jgi:DNA (cytosine-5)-methyltransferase 1